MLITLHEIIRNLSGYKKQSQRTWCGPCPRCGGNDRFIVWINEDRFSCRGCDFKGDIITWLREVEGKSCGEAFLAADRRCDSEECEAFGKCVATRDGITPRAPRTDKQRRLCTPELKEKQDDWKPMQALTPAEMWQERALSLVNDTHEALLANPEQLEYLEKRGLPLGAVKKDRLGWIEKDIYKSRASWGLSPKKERRDGTETATLWIPRGIVIPFFAIDGSVHRIRIRRDQIKQGEIRYYWLEGSGDDTWMLNPNAKAQIVIETDLDGLMIDWHAGDIVGAIPLGSCSPRPKEKAAAILDRAVCILNALDFEPRVNEKNGRNEAPGGENWLRFWKPRYPQAKRHPAPGGKDAGEAYQKGLNIRAWIIAGLPAGLRPASPETETKQPIQETEPVKTETETVKAETSDASHASDQSDAVPMRIIEGREIYFPSRPDDYRRLAKEGKIVIGPREVKIMAEASAEGLPLPPSGLLLDVKEIFPGAFLSSIEKIIST